MRPTRRCRSMPSGFCSRRNALPEDCWNVYEYSLDDGQVRQVTRDVGNCRQPGYQSNLFTVDSPEPWFQLTFVSDAAGWMNENGSGPVRSLYSCRLDGSEVRRLTYNLSDDLDPFLMGDGRLLYASWQRATLDRGPLGRVALFAVNIEGTDNALFGDPAGKRIKRMPCVTDRGLVLFIESDDGNGRRLWPDRFGDVSAAAEVVPGGDDGAGWIRLSGPVALDAGSRADRAAAVGWECDERRVRVLIPRRWPASWCWMIRPMTRCKRWRFAPLANRTDGRRWSTMRSRWPRCTA